MSMLTRRHTGVYLFTAHGRQEGVPQHLFGSVQTISIKPFVSISTDLSCGLVTTYVIYLGFLECKNRTFL